jgi:hypothetical protein
MRRFHQLLQLTARGIPGVGADALHDFNFGQRSGGHLCQKRIVRLVVHNGDRIGLGPRARLPPGNLALKTVNGLMNGSDSTRLTSGPPLTLTRWAAFAPSLLPIQQAEIFGQVEGTLRDPAILEQLSNDIYLSWELIKTKRLRIRTAAQRPNRVHNYVELQLVAARSAAVGPDFDGVTPGIHRKSNRLSHWRFSNPDAIDEDSPSDAGDAREDGSPTGYFDHGLTGDCRYTHSASVAEGSPSESPMDVEGGFGVDGEAARRRGERRPPSVALP